MSTVATINGAVCRSADGSLAALLEEQKLGWADILRALVDTADGMLYLSHTGFVHRVSYDYGADEFECRLTPL